MTFPRARCRRAERLGRLRPEEKWRRSWGNKERRFIVRRPECAVRANGPEKIQVHCGGQAPRRPMFVNIVGVWSEGFVELQSTDVNDRGL